MKKATIEKIIITILLVVYLLIVLKLSLFQVENLGGRSINIIPFRGGASLAGASKLLGKALLFVPFGYMVTVLSSKHRHLLRILAGSFFLSLTLELAQYILAQDISDVDDLLLNTVGGLGGFFIYTFGSRFFKTKKGWRTTGSFLLVLVAGLVYFIGIPENKHDFFEESVLGFATTDAQSTIKTTTDSSDWALILVNKWHTIPNNYSVELKELSNGQLIDQRIYPFLQKMFDAARAENVYPVVVSGYRSTKEQQKLLDEKIAEYQSEGYGKNQAEEKAEQWVALPGTSEHQLGIAVDINEDQLRSSSEEVYGWLKINAHKFGFINRYPANKTTITGVINEPWHYRYVGVAAATKIYDQAICLEEYLAQ